MRGIQASVEGVPALTFAQESSEVGIDEQINQAFKPISDFFSSVIAGIEEVAQEAGYNVMIFQSNAW